MIESIDNGFQPTLRKQRLGPKHYLWLAKWGIPLQGSPAPTEHTGYKAAVWHGDYNNLGETPVVALLTEKQSRAYASSVRWFFGVALEKVIEIQPVAEPALVSAADYEASSAVNAIDLLVHFIPPDISFPQSDTPLSMLSAKQLIKAINEMKSASD